MMRRRLVFVILLFVASVRVYGAESLAELARRFHGQCLPVKMTYDIRYRFLGMDLGQLGRMELVSTIGQWDHRVTGAAVPAVFLEIRVRSMDSLRGAGGRTRINDRMVAVLDLPGMNALVFAKELDQELNPVFGRSSTSRAVSCYDTQGGAMEYCKRDLRTGVVSTNLTAPEAMFALSRKVGGILSFLDDSYRGTAVNRGISGGDAVAVNLEGRVVSIRLVTEPARSPSCLDRRRFEALHIRAVPEGGAAVRARDFQAWGLPFSELARVTGDNALREAARQAPVDAIVPLVMDYELALGSVRVVLAGSGVESLPDSLAAAPEGPETMGQEDPAAGDGLGAQFGQHRAKAEPVVEEPQQSL